MKPRVNLVFIITVGCLFSEIVSFATSAGSVVAIREITTPPVIDGKLEDQVWKEASTFTDFKTIRPDFGHMPSELTEIHLLYTTNHIYVAFQCYDRAPEKIKYTLTRRDNAFSDDWIAFCLDTFNDELNAFFFMANPLGIQMDGTLNADASPDITLDMVWVSAGQVTAHGYTVEMAIPFESLRLPPQEDVVMGFKAARTISRKSEEVDFPEFHPEGGPALGQFQKIRFSGLKTKRILEILPAFTLSQTSLRQEGTFKNQDPARDIGVTAKWGLTSEMVLDATVNPDFSQIETDAGQIDVNLRHALYYPEKRSFFLEGQDHFQYGASVEDGPLGAVIHTRQIVDPKAGVRIQGKVGQNNRISLLYANDEYVDGADSFHLNDQEQENVHVSAFRYSRRIKGDSYLGGFVIDRRVGRYYNTVAGGDGRIRMNAKTSLEYHGFGSWTRSKNTDKIKAGHAFSTVLFSGNRRYNMQTGLINVSRHFQTDVGYLRRTGVTIIPLYFQYNHYINSNWMQRVEPYYWARQAWDHDSGLMESFNVFALRFQMVRQTWVNFQGWIANEVFAGERFLRDAIRCEGASQLWNALHLEWDIRSGRFIHYDPQQPYQGEGYSMRGGILFQPFGNLSLGLDMTHAHFRRSSDNKKIYDYTIYRNRTVYQVNRYLFVRSVLEYNTYRKRLNADFLISFTYIPGTVLYLGYGSVYERDALHQSSLDPENPFRNTERHLFFKASYLWRY